MGNITLFGSHPDMLRPAERKLLDAARTKKIKDYEPKEYYVCCAKLAERICAIVGLRKLELSSMKLIADFLRDYYGDLTFREVLVAFELCLVGELDPFLPKTRDGMPERNHYQNFSVEYITRILNAYRKYKGSVEVKRIESQPKLLPAATDEEKAEAVKYMLDNIKMIYLRYKYTGRMETTLVNELTIYRELDRLGLAVPVEVSDEDKRQAVIRLNKKTRNGVFNEFVGSCLRNLHERHPYVPDEAVFVARRRAVRTSFDEIIKDEIQLIELL